jgi:outer membrane protein assembly factor BamB
MNQDSKRLYDYFSRLLLVAAVFVCGSTSCEIAADDWPNWMGANRDGVWRESGIIKRFPESGPEVVWRQPIGGGYGGPAIVGEFVYVMDRTADDGKGQSVENDLRQAGEIQGGERVQCLRLSDGIPVWQHTYDCGYRIAYPNGPRCTPTVDGEHVYTLGAMGRLICFERSSGEVRWQIELTEKYRTRPPVWGFASHPIIDGNKLIVPVGGEGSGVAAFDKNNGQEIWRAVTTMDVAYAPLIIYSNKVNNHVVRQLIFWHADGITSLDPENGQQFWYVKFPEEQNPSQTSIATPRIFDNKLLISEFYKGSLLLELGSGPPSVKELWRSHKTDPRNENSLNAMMATPFVKAGFAYGIAYDGRGQGVYRCIDLKTGETKWTKTDWLGKKPIMFATAFAVENDGRYYMFSDTGELLIAEMDETGFRELSRAEIIEPSTPARGRIVVWCHPAFASKKMVVRNDKEIVCVNLAE